MINQELFKVRQALLQTYLRERGYDGVLLSRADNFAMATGGRRNYFWTHGDVGSNAIYVPAEGPALFVGDTIHLVLDVISTHPGTSARVGSIDRRLTLVNQSGENVQQGYSEVLVLKKQSAKAQ